MLAIVAAILFGLSLIFDWAGVAAGGILTSGTLTTLGLLFLALYVAGVGPGFTPSWRAKAAAGTGTRRRWRR